MKPNNYVCLLFATLPIFCCAAATTVSIASGDGQSASVTTDFSTPLSVLVSDGTGPVQNAIVTFTAPSTGVTGTFAGGLSVATIVTGVNGIATAPQFIAGTLAGPYQVGVAVSGAAPVAFNLTNNPGPVDHVIIEQPGGGAMPGSIVLSGPINVQYTVKDSQNNTVTSFNGGAYVTISIHFGNGIFGRGGAVAFNAGVFVDTIAATLFAAGPGTLSIGVQLTSPPVSSSATITVLLPSSGFRIFHPTMAKVGQPISLTIYAPFSSYTGLFHISSNDSTAVLPVDAPFPGSSPHTFTVTFYTAGIYGVSCNDVAAPSIHDNGLNGSLDPSISVTGPFFNLSAPSISVGSPTTNIGGAILFGSSAPSGLITISVGGVSANASIDAVTGNFSANLDTHALTVAGSPYTITYSFPGDGVNPAASATATLTATKSTPTIAWSAPTDITYGTSLSATQLNATSSVLGTFSYTPSVGTLLQAGPSQSISVTFTPADSSTYNATSATVSINVLKATPVIGWNNPADVIYGVALGSAQLNANTPTAGSFIYTPPAATLLNAGLAQTLSATFIPIDPSNYNSAIANVQINVLKATPTITWLRPTPIFAGTALSETQLNASANVPGTFKYLPPLGTVMDVGSGQTLSVQFTAADPNFLSAAGAVTMDVISGAPSFTSPLSAAPNPAISGKPISFAAFTSDPQGNLDSYTWSFGDGSSGSGATPQHTYTAPGVYPVAATVSNALGDAVSTTLFVSVSAATISLGEGATGPTLTDSNGDGIPDQMQGAANASGFATPQSTLPISKATLSVALNFSRPSHDSIQGSGSLTLPADFRINGAAVIVNIGGFVQTFKLDMNGKSKSGGTQFSISSKGMRGLGRNPSEYQFNLRIRNADLVSTLADSGLANTNIKDLPLDESVALMLGDNLYLAAAHGRYSARKDRTGQLKNAP